MPDKRCPQCHLWNTDSALVCDCGFDFSTGAMSGTHTSDTPLVSAPWRISLSYISVVLIPVFVFAAALIVSLDRFTPLLIILLLTMLILPPIYWLLYFTCLQRPWARYLMLFMAVACVLAFVLIIAAIVMNSRASQ
jgi:hypothetical protein